LVGNRVLEQITERLLGKTNLSEEVLDDGTVDIHDVSFKQFVEKIRRNGNSFNFPAFFIHKVVEKKKKNNEIIKTIVYCEGFTIITKFPDNIVRLSVVENCHLLPNLLFRNAFAIDQIFFDTDGCLKIRVRMFSKLENTFTQPYPSKRIKNYLSLKGICANFEIVPFSRIVGKYFAIPLKMQYEFNPFNQLQTWNLQEMPHSQF
jgi:hypothetical protein